MILTIESSIATFKTLNLVPGLNVLLAETTPDATERQTRNSAGKTSFVEIVHFLLGSNCDKDSLFRVPELIKEWFAGVFLIDGRPLRVERSGSTPSRIYLEGNTDGLLLSLKIEKSSNRKYASNTNWRIFLGHLMFDLPAHPEGSDFAEPDAPSFRSLFSYFARRRSADGLLHPERHAGMQQRADWQVNLSYLLGLDWRVPHAFQAIRDREKTLDELKRASKAGALSNLVGTVAELRPQLAIAEDKASLLRAQLENFEVLESYKDLSQRAARIRADMQATSRELVSYRETAEHLKSALAAEQPPSAPEVESMYQAVGIQLPGLALKRFEEVEKFHASVVANRKKYLQAEWDRTIVDIDQAENRLASSDADRRDTLKTLEGKGALEDFLRLQRDLAELEASAANLRERFKAATMLEGEATQLDLDRSNLKRRLQEDHVGRASALNRAILLISRSITALYEGRTGSFVVDAGQNGPEFAIKIEGDRGGGIASMEIFCLDLAIFLIAHERFKGPGFLIHDSHLFDGVDERQIAEALRLGAAAAGDTRQYIVTMNSDIYDRLPFPEGYDRSGAVLATRLSDATETGGLFGFKFG